MEVQRIPEILGQAKISSQGDFPGLVALTLMHFLVDLHSGMLPVILLYQRASLQLSLTQIGILAGVYNFGLSLAQPFFGYLADRWGEKRFAMGGLIWIALLGAGLGFAHSFPALLALATLAAFGSSSFHPAGASSASRHNLNNRGAGMSFFLVGGSIGYALGPLVAGGVFENYGLHGTWIISAGALTLIALLLSIMKPFKPGIARAGKPDPNPAGTRQPGVKTLSAAVLVGLLAVILVSGARTWIYQGLSNFIPQQMTALGFSNTRATYWLSIMLGINSLGVLIGGPLTDRFGPRRIITAGMAALAPVLIALSLSRTNNIGVSSALAGFLVGLPVAAILLVGQSFLPRGTSMASGLVLGISFAIGALGIALTGVIADHSGLMVAILVFAFLAFLAAISGLLMPGRIPAAVINK
jgi:FSR family fosmidomycin resistance protein-like MFS transporter